MYKVTAYYVVNGSKSERKEISKVVNNIEAIRKEMQAEQPEGYKIFFEYIDLSIDKRN